MSISTEVQTERQRVLSILEKCQSNNWRMADCEIALLAVRKGLTADDVRIPTQPGDLGKMQAAQGD